MSSEIESSEIKSDFYKIRFDKNYLFIDLIRTKSCIFQNYEHLMKVNEKASGGSFYLQSKVRTRTKF